MKSEVAVVGDVFADMVSHVISYPQNGDGTYGTPLERSSGGTGGNVAAGLGCLDIPTTMVCRLGDDDTGRYLKENMKEYGVDNSGMYLDPASKTGSVVITVDPSGERTIFVFVMDGAYGKLDSDNVSILDKINPKAIFITGVLLGLHPAEEAVFSVAEKWKGKAKLYFDPNLRYPKDAIPAEIKSSMQKMSKLCDVVLAGEGEMNALEMYPVEGQTYIVKCGSKGSKLIDSNMKTILTVPATDHVAVDATGAGDTFAAAYIAGELQGMDIKAAMVYASVAAGFSVTKAGARNMPSDAEIKEYILKNNL